MKESTVGVGSGGEGNSVCRLRRQALVTGLEMPSPLNMVSLTALSKGARPRRPAQQVRPSTREGGMPEHAAEASGARPAPAHGTANATFNLGVLCEMREAGRRAQGPGPGGSTRRPAARVTRVPPSTSAFSTLYAEQGDVGRARELYDSMRRPAAGGTRVPPPTSAFCTRVRGRDEGQGDVDRARQCYEEAHGKGEVNATFNLGVLCEKQGDVRRARGLYDSTRRPAARVTWVPPSTSSCSGAWATADYLLGGARSDAPAKIAALELSGPASVMVGHGFEFEQSPFIRNRLKARKGWFQSTHKVRKSSWSSCGSWSYPWRIEILQQIGIG